MGIDNNISHQIDDFSSCEQGFVKSERFHSARRKLLKTTSLMLPSTKHVHLNGMVGNRAEPSPHAHIPRKDGNGNVMAKRSTQRYPLRRSSSYSVQQQMVYPNMGLKKSSSSLSLNGTSSISEVRAKNANSLNSFENLAEPCSSVDVDVSGGPQQEDGNMKTKPKNQGSRLKRSTSYAVRQRLVPPLVVLQRSLSLNEEDDNALHNQGSSSSIGVMATTMPQPQRVLSKEEESKVLKGSGLEHSGSRPLNRTTSMPSVHRNATSNNNGLNKTSAAPRMPAAAARNSNRADNVKSSSSLRFLNRPSSPCEELRNVAISSPPRQGRNGRGALQKSLSLPSFNRTSPLRDEPKESSSLDRTSSFRDDVMRAPPLRCLLMSSKEKREESGSKSSSSFEGFERASCSNWISKNSTESQDSGNQKKTSLLRSRTSISSYREGLKKSSSSRSFKLRSSATQDTNGSSALKTSPSALSTNSNFSSGERTKKASCCRQLETSSSATREGACRGTVQKSSSQKSLYSMSSSRDRSKFSSGEGLRKSSFRSLERSPAVLRERDCNVTLQKSSSLKSLSRSSSPRYRVKKTSSSLEVGIYRSELRPSSKPRNRKRSSSLSSLRRVSASSEGAKTTSCARSVMESCSEAQKDHVAMQKSSSLLSLNGSRNPSNRLNKATSLVSLEIFFSELRPNRLSTHKRSSSLSSLNRVSSSWEGLKRLSCSYSTKKSCSEAGEDTGVSQTSSSLQSINRSSTLSDRLKNNATSSYSLQVLPSESRPTYRPGTHKRSSSLGSMNGGSSSWDGVKSTSSSNSGKKACSEMRKDRGWIRKSASVRSRNRSSSPRYRSKKTSSSASLVTLPSELRRNANKRSSSLSSLSRISSSLEEGKTTSSSNFAKKPCSTRNDSSAARKFSSPRSLNRSSSPRYRSKKTSFSASLEIFPSELRKPYGPNTHKRSLSLSSLDRSSSCYTSGSHSTNKSFIGPWEDHGCSAIKISSSALSPKRQHTSTDRIKKNSSPCNVKRTSSSRGESDGNGASSSQRRLQRSCSSPLLKAPSSATLTKMSSVQGGTRISAIVARENGSCTNDDLIVEKTNEKKKRFRRHSSSAVDGAASAVPVGGSSSFSMMNCSSLLSRNGASSSAEALGENTTCRNQAPSSSLRVTMTSTASQPPLEGSTRDYSFSSPLNGSSYLPSPHRTHVCFNGREMISSPRYLTTHSSTRRDNYASRTRTSISAQSFLNSSPLPCEERKKTDTSRPLEVSFPGKEERDGRSNLFKSSYLLFLNTTSSSRERLDKASSLRCLMDTASSSKRLQKSSSSRSRRTSSLPRFFKVCSESRETTSLSSGSGSVSSSVGENGSHRNDDHVVHEKEKERTGCSRHTHSASAVSYRDSADFLESAVESHDETADRETHSEKNSTQQENKEKNSRKSQRKKRNKMKRVAMDMSSSLPSFYSSGFDAVPHMSELEFSEGSVGENSTRTCVSATKRTKKPSRNSSIVSFKDSTESEKLTKMKNGGVLGGTAQFPVEHEDFTEVTADLTEVSTATGDNPWCVALAADKEGDDTDFAADCSEFNTDGGEHWWDAAIGWTEVQPDQSSPEKSEEKVFSSSSSVHLHVEEVEAHNADMTEVGTTPAGEVSGLVDYLYGIATKDNLFVESTVIPVLEDLSVWNEKFRDVYEDWKNHIYFFGPFAERCYPLPNNENGTISNGFLKDRFT